VLGGLEALSLDDAQIINYTVLKGDIAASLLGLNEPNALVVAL
jgi:hypothetical protein